MAKSKKKAAPAVEVVDEVRNTDEFLRKFARLDSAGISVTLCRTREPFRASDSLREYAAMTGGEFRIWSITNGWSLYDNEQPDAAPTPDKDSDILSAMAKINDPEAGFGEKGVFVVMYPHKVIDKNFLLSYIFKEYGFLLSDSLKRVVLIAPPGYNLPDELKEEVTVLDFEEPSRTELRDSYDALLQMMRDGNPDASIPDFPEDDIASILASGAGMTSLDFENAVTRALIAYNSDDGCDNIDAFNRCVLNAKTEVVKRSEVLEMMPEGRMSEIGGLENLKTWIGKRGRCFTPEAREAGVETPKGAAFIGPPGTGKSLCAKAIASELNLPAFRFDVGKVFQHLVGNSEQRVRDALAMVDAMSPCVLMIDEADKAFAGQAGGGGGGDSGVGMRVLGAILTWMQETESEVFVVVTANRVENLPTEFLRRGRLDEIFSVTVPHEGERLEILKIHLRKRKVDPDTLDGLDDVAAGAAAFVPSELEAAIKDAKIEAFVAGTELTAEMIKTELDRINPISIAFAEDFRRMQEWAENHARPASLLYGATEEPSRRAQANAAPSTPTGGRVRSRSIDASGGASGNSLDG